jgi:ElaB/YqjD/DUF883 family membrane-anchored ribosome-binding protein
MIESIPTKPGARDQLMSDLKSVIADAEQWLRHGGQLTGDELAAAKAKFERTITNAKADLIRLETAVVERTKEAAKATDEFVHENPWKAVGISAAIGLAIGVIISRTR